MVDFISEVEEELRKDDYNKFLRRYGPFIIGLLVAVVAFVGFLEWRKIADQNVARGAATSYLAAADLLEDGNVDGARQAFLDLADVAPDGYAGLSLMRAAVIAGEQGNPSEAVRLYDLAAERFELDRHVDLARLKAAYVLANEGRWSDVRMRADQLAGEGAPYEYLARELAASAALNAGDLSAARAGFSYLKSIIGAPPSVVQRAEQALLLIDSETGANLPAPSVPDLPVPSGAELDAQTDDQGTE